MFLTFTKWCLLKDVLIFECHLYQRELKRNRIKIVESLTFQGLESLKSLKMQRNGISRLMDGAFFGLGNIEELWVCLVVEFLLGTLAVEGCVLYGFPYIKAVLRYWWASQEIQICISPLFWYHVWLFQRWKDIGSLPNFFPLDDQECFDSVGCFLVVFICAPHNMGWFFAVWLFDSDSARVCHAVLAKDFF